MTLQEIKNDVYFNAKITASTLPDADITKYINDGYKEAQMLIRGINENFFLTSATTNLQLDSVNQSLYTFPLNMDKIVQVQVALQPQNSAAPLDSEFVVAHFISQGQLQQPGTLFTQPKCIAFGNYFKLYPKLENTGIVTYPVTNGMKMYYIKDLPDLSAGTDVPDFDASYHQYITWYTVEIIGNRLEKDAIKKFGAEKKKEWAEKLKTYIAGREIDTMGLIVEGQFNNGGWDYNFGYNGY